MQLACHNAKSQRVDALLAFLTTTEQAVMSDDIILPPNSKAIPLTRGLYTIVDDADYESLSKWKWFARAGDTKDKYYASRGQHLGVKNGKPIKTTIQMHNVILPPVDGLEVDHINGDSLDNRRENLRLCTHKQNIWNRKAVRGSASKYKGVDWYAASGNWRAYIKIDGKQKHLGCYANEDDAARAYNKAALEHHGEYARLNPVRGEPAPRIIHPYQNEWHKRKGENNG